MRELRTTPLAQCPDLACHREGRCRMGGGPRECHKTSLTMDERRRELAALLNDLCDGKIPPRARDETKRPGDERRRRELAWRLDCLCKESVPPHIANSGELAEAEFKSQTE